MLELIDRGPRRSSTDEHPVPLLFIHGAWHAAWCWDEHFLEYFAARGYRAVAVSLRGHGRSPGRERLRANRIRDYVDDVAEAVARLPVPPVLIGHSMGGFVVQHYLEKHTAVAAILVAPMPPTGAGRVTVYAARHHTLAFLKANAALRLGPMVATPDLARALFFSASMPDAQVNLYQRRLQDESYRAFLDMLALDLVRTKRVNRVPMLALGAENDTLLTQRQLHRTAAAYGAEVQIFGDMAHDMMLESGWEAVAERIDGWLTAQGW
jgi:pimeloyl-ACP methyl ester carboxylesterase